MNSFFSRGWSAHKRAGGSDESRISGGSGCQAVAVYLALTMLIAGAAVGWSQNNPPTGPSTDDILQFLEQAVGWYHQMDVQRQLAMDPGDVLLINEEQQMAVQIVRLAFDFARAEAEIMEREPGPKVAENQNSGSSRYQSLLRRSAALDQQVRATKAEVESLRQKLGTATGRQRQALQTQIAETQSEVDLTEVRRDSLRSMADFVGGSSANGLGATGLRAKIETLARSVPAALAKSTTGQENVPSSNGQLYPAASAARKSAPSGVWGLAADLFVLSRNSRTLADSIRLTDSLAEKSRGMRTPLVTGLREMSKRGDDLAQQADSADQAALAREKKEIDALTAQFKQTSAAVLPLSKQGILLGLYKGNLTDWQSTINNQYSTELRSLLVRLGILVVFLAAVIAAAELWRRTIFRYVHDLRRRHQFLLLRKIVLCCVVTVILVFAFANELSSIATFAGLITAGVAVALQSVILSIVGYFFLIGKFGIRVGDRVQVAGVIGEVVDVGLVRFHLLELIGGGGKMPTGRVVAFSNSIVFQSTAGLFKQIPGTNFIWHEITLSLASTGDYGSVEEHLRGAVEAVFSEYREEMEQQHRRVEKTLTTTPLSALQPASRLRFTQSGLEVMIRYPVDLQHAAEIDDRVTRKLLETIDREPKLTPAGSTAPSIKLKTDVSVSDS